MNPAQFNSTFPAPLIAVFRAWLHIGWVDLGNAMGHESASPPTYRTFGQFVSAHAVQRPGWEKTLVRDFLAEASNDGAIRETLRQWLVQMIPWLLKTAVEKVEPTEVGEWEALKTINQQRLAGAGQERLGSTLMEVFEAEMANFTLLDAFLRRRNEVGFASWSQYNTEMLESAKAKPKWQISPDSRPLFLMTCSPSLADGPIPAVEGVGGSKNADQSQWNALAAGMLYQFNPRTRANRERQLLHTAHEVSNADFERAEAFVSMLPDPQAVLAKGDVVIVWEWERRHGTTPGGGIALMETICRALRHRYRQLATIVFTLSPERVIPRSAGEPPVVAEMRLSDLDKLHSYVLSVGDRLGLNVYCTASDHNDVDREPEIVYT